MSDLAAVVLALATALGAWVARPVPPLLGVGLVVMAFTFRRPWLLWLGCAVLASALAASSWAGLRAPAPMPVDATVTLLRDPADIGGATRAVARLGPRHVELSGRGSVGRVLGDRLAGERVRVVGRLGPVSASVRRQLALQHVAAEVDVTTVVPAGEGNAPSRLANRLRRLLVRGAVSMPLEQRTLFTGFVLGDDRGQSAETVDDFRTSGLSHLLVVSGENVAFVLALAGPLLRRFGLRWRLGSGLILLGLFGVLTRWEPSVLRAEAMAAIAMAAQALGRPVSTARALALAVTGILLADPLLVGSVGFLLSVGACTGIALFAERLTAVLPGPRPIAAAVGVTLAAQAGVAPVLVPVFGALPVSTLPANLLAMPAAGPVMIWGVVAGLPAGVVGGRVAAILHLPTRLLVGWIAMVARLGARAPLGRLGATALLAVAGALVGAVLFPRIRRPALVGAATICLVPAVVLAAGRPPPSNGREIADGARLWRHGSTTVLVIDRPQPSRLLSAVRARGIGHVDVVVARRGGSRTLAALDPLSHRIGFGVVLAASPIGAIAHVVVVRTGAEARAGPFLVTVTAVQPTLDVRIDRITR